MKKQAKLILTGIAVVAVLAALFVLPISKKPFDFGGKVAPWRLGLDLVGGSHLVYEVDMSNVEAKDRDSVMGGLKDVIERRVNLFGVSEPQVITAKEGDSHRLIVELAGVPVEEAIKQIGETPMLDFREVIEIGTSTAFLPTQLTGRYLKKAQMTFDQTLGTPSVSLEFNEEGGKLFEELTARNIGKPVAIFLDGQPIEVPTVQEKISGGTAQITGKFTSDEARKMVERFNAGALSAPMSLMSQQTVGASLGQESLKKAIDAGIYGTLIIVLFMLVYYRGFGLYASLALVVYILLTAALFKFGVTMTLAGIAGYILSIGMAVDANILIFERTKEELKRGLSRSAAIEEGFRRAWSSIRDSNISTGITCLILFVTTSSFVKGFALTLGIGVLVSMFSAITVTRLLMYVFSTKEHK
ncbi:MAG: Preprotein translocase subunit SecD [Candidatus Wolfebacteria bacterium GW2011_GWC2_46_275]|uniref:Protein translocase subunit SecD n=2 Tax=Candidatus Wolfeibacteriota TaxID=1752735 RepID=A0A0G1U879_9BACT|nr:MAG: protein-export membrane protein SecD, preprotein translocase subunit SecD [Candidatus Wolfebacteria bacterium GW2011_GWB1_47_1]KKU35387.1 MAG: Preprotein translocase subunit SecD [Candidatus Wolfebacteria bacterium GW2011_GWC2_46_275]KKU42717.1 MAG: Preprotein translocase subunit SecD [Candidatus Wolfebacteria bacterium GW2011_GWB2_46_69]KKU54549.1 MAG: Preprotein translocase subunit SecD [Candidatus Wolfebacteria bacterium GW2011_GWC1_47_103]KKU59933.1 MAG: Preprotein translocase subun